MIRRAAVFAMACGILFGCKKSSVNNSKLEGKWQLSAMFLQTSGPGSWHAQDTIPADYIQFNSGGSLTMSAYVSSLYNDPVGYTVTSDSTIAFSYPNGGNTLYGENIVHYQISDSILLIVPPSIEYVEEKYIRAQIH